MFHHAEIYISIDQGMMRTSEVGYLYCLTNNNLKNQSYQISVLYLFYGDFAAAIFPFVADDLLAASEFCLVNKDSVLACLAIFTDLKRTLLC